ncbi:MAG: S8 family serine peptidase, partial [Oceanococcaceae bacterium]
MTRISPWALLCGLLLSPVALANWQLKVAPELLNPAPGTEWMVALPHTADLSPADSIPDKALKGAFVMHTLKEQARSTQGPLLNLLQSLGLEHRSYWISNAVHVRGGDALALQQIANLPGVDYIHAVAAPDFSRSAAPMPQSTPTQSARAEADSGMMVEPGLLLVRADEVWADGIEGQGAVVGDHDIGVEWTHPALKNNYRGYDAESDSAVHDYNWRNAFGALDPFCGTDEPCDSHDHGTHTTGTMVGEDKNANLRIGMAPKAEWIACRSLLDPVVGLGTFPSYLDCMQWFIAPHPIDDTSAGDPALAPDVVNNSWGCLEACIPPMLKDANDATKAAGIVQVVSAGNDGGECSTILFPLAVYEESFSVGASNFEDEMAGFSSRGPVLSDLSMRTKPNVVAPGVSINSATTGNGYGSMSGTSMAGPHVAGLVALMISAEPRLRGQVDVIRSLIEETAVPINNDQACGETGAQDIPNNVFGY